MVTVQHIGQSKKIGGMNFEFFGGWGHADIYSEIFEFSKMLKMSKK